MYNYKDEFIKYGPLSVNVDRASDEESIDWDAELPCPPSPYQRQRTEEATAAATEPPASQQTETTKATKATTKSKKKSKSHVPGKAWLDQQRALAEYELQVGFPNLFLN